VINIFRSRSLRLPHRKTIRIYSNGRTEKNYFNLQKKAYRGSRTVKVIHKEGKEIKTILEKIKRECDGRSLISGDKIFCVVDVDTLTDINILEVFRVKPKYVDLILSNPNFELWLLLHFQCHTTRITKDETEPIVRAHLHEYHKPNIEPFFSQLKENETTAMRNAKVLRAQHLKEEVDLNSIAANPHTYVDYVIEFLNLH
jgi:hypothetical protein